MSFLLPPNDPFRYIQILILIAGFGFATVTILGVIAKVIG